MAETHTGRNRVDSELDRLRQKVENFPSPSAYVRLAELLRASGDVAGAVTVCQRCVREFPRTGQAFVIMAEVDFVEQRVEDGLAKLRQAVERDPRNYAAHRMLAEHCATAGDVTQALALLRHILTFKPNDADILKRITALSPKGAVPVAVPQAAAAPRPLTGTLRRSVPSSAIPAIPAPRGLGPLVSEAGVRGALIADEQGRIVSSLGLAPDQDEILAALAAEFSRDAAAAVTAAGQGGLVLWAISAGQGQILAFRRDDARSVVILAEPGVRPALLEIRARQALAELGAG
jgi:predicted regulator of Ras-like GTPase activity (Roadblock/LC7/MglB family)